jgi:hypothetical protein
MGMVVEGHPQSQAVMQIPWATFSEELWIIILASLPKSDLKRLCRVSKHLHALIIPILYQVIDLSIHHLEAMPSSDPRIARIHAQQFLFVSQVLLKPEFGSYVQSFTWTMSLYMRRQLPEWIKDKRVLWTVEDTYRMFSLLYKARHVDLDTGAKHVERVPVLPSLFPSATSIRLGGKMHFALATAILHGANKASLTSLSLNNVQEGGLLSSGANFLNHMPTRFNPNGKVDFATFRENWPKDSLPVQVAPGSMRRLLTSSLQSRCRHLRYLFLCKQGQQHRTQGQPHPFQSGPSSLTYEDDVYYEWASFLWATHPNIVIFAHGGVARPKPLLLSNRYSCNIPLLIPPPIPARYMQLSDLAPMDKRFRDIVLPVLKDGWPRLKKVEVRGVNIKVLTELKNLEGVEVVIDKEVRACYNGMVGED